MAMPGVKRVPGPVGDFPWCVVRNNNRVMIEPQVKNVCGSRPTHHALLMATSESPECVATAHSVHVHTPPQRRGTSSPVRPDLPRGCCICPGRRHHPVSRLAPTSSAAPESHAIAKRVHDEFENVPIVHASLGPSSSPMVRIEARTPLSHNGLRTRCPWARDSTSRTCGSGSSR